jgi:hypothetical protein
MKNTWSLIIAAAAVLLLLYFLSSSGKKPPRIPADAIHGALKTNESCLTCHAPGKSVPLKDAHPPKEQCLACHKAA